VRTSHREASHSHAGSGQWQSGCGVRAERERRLAHGGSRIAQDRARRGELDAEEARWLREAEALQIWRPLGMVSALDYCERVLGHAPRAAQDRLRVARALGTLPELTRALGAGTLPYSAVRELIRVATPATEAAWIAAASGTNLRQIESLVSGHRPGDQPDDPPGPEVRTQVVRFELSSGTFAQLRQASSSLDDEHGRHLSDDELVAALCSSVLDGSSATEPTGRAKFQIAVTVCERCRQGWQDGAGARIAIETAAVERAMCDAQHIGSLDGDGPERAHQDVPPSMVRFVWRRDGGRCRAPGCRSARGLEVHHLVHRADGGGHEASNLVLLCSACHLAHHRGALYISGTADQLLVDRTGERGPAADAGPHVGLDEPATWSTPGTRAGSTDVPGRGRALDANDGSATAPMQATTWDAVGGTRPSAAPIVNAIHTAADAAAMPTDGAIVGRKLDEAVLHAQAKQALVGLGWKTAIAQSAVAAALAALGPAAPLERLIFEALRRCPRPTA
jgi:hypothetical protein